MKELAEKHARLPLVQACLLFFICAALLALTACSSNEESSPAYSEEELALFSIPMEDSLDYVSDQELLDSIELFVQRAGDDVATLYGSDFSYALDQNNTGGDIGQVIFSIAKPGYPDCYSGQLTAIAESVDGSWFISDCAPSSTVMESSPGTINWPDWSDQQYEDLYGFLTQEPPAVGNMNVSFAGGVDFDKTSRQGPIYLFNTPSNEYGLQLSLMLEDSSIKLASSPLLKPGAGVLNISIDNILAEGAYTATALCTFYDLDTGENVGEYRHTIPIAVF